MSRRIATVKTLEAMEDRFEMVVIFSDCGWSGWNEEDGNNGGYIL